ncbi:N-acetylglucosaminyldiphosphodolichol N-acetylglucosaminyltransferase catalytic subunit alg13 [Loxospora ochrophaea]|nr:N-acetylglucosaminyldiphosphodolichol N-acetylglucosaminyltransferase catalytic subunit alg13 [Loxospora ochrophaea]
MALEATPIKKVCFVTIGATASFDSLIEASLSPSFLKSLKTAGYTDLLLQHGKDGGKVLQAFNSRYSQGSPERYGLHISGFDFNQQGLGAEMRAAKGEGSKAQGAVISHAGTGSILDGLRISVPLIVVPNPALLDGHQEELAEELAAQGYVIYGKLDNLPGAIQQSEVLRTKQQVWPPVNTTYDSSGRGLVGIMDDEMGFVD